MVEIISRTENRPLSSPLSSSDSKTPAIVKEKKKEKRETANKKYNEDNVNVFVTGSGTIEQDKVNVELIPNNVNPKTQKSNPTILIHNSQEIRDVDEQKRILEIVMNNSSFDTSVFTRTSNSYITEWKAHNILYDFSFFSNYLRKKFGSADMDEDEVVAWDIAWQ